MAKALSTRDLLRGVAVFSGYVDSVRHVGDDDYGRSGDWVDVAIFGGIVTLPLVTPLEVNDQVIVTGTLRNRGKVIDLVPTDMLICRTDEELTRWDSAFNGSYRATLSCKANAYGRESKIAHKTTQKFNCRWQGVGLQFTLAVDQNDYLIFKQVENDILDWHFDLIRSFRVQAQGERLETYDTWTLDNPHIINNNKTRRQAPTATEPAK